MTGSFTTQSGLGGSSSELLYTVPFPLGLTNIDHVSAMRETPTKKLTPLSPSGLGVRLNPSETHFTHDGSPLNVWF